MGTGSPQPKALPPDGLIHRNPDIVYSTIDGEVVMMSLDLGEYYGLDAIGSRIWLLLENPMRVGELCAILAGDFDVDPERCGNDVGGFLAEILDCGLIRVSL